MTAHSADEYWNVRRFVQGLRSAVQSLPTDERRRELAQLLDALIAFLTDFRSAFNSLPTIDQSSALLDAVSRIQGHLEEAEKNPALADLFGLRSKGRSRLAQPRVTRDADLEAARLAEDLRSRSMDEICGTLGSDRYGLPLLRALARQVGMRPAKGVKREALAHQIATKIVNFRGYETLSGRSSSLKGS